MNTKHLAAYVDFRRLIFDHKIESTRFQFAATEDHLLKAAGPGVRGLTPLEGGSLSTCWRFDNRDGSFVLRIPVNEQLAPSLIAEDWAANVAKDAHFPSVVPILTDTSRYVVPFSYQILPFVTGDGEFKVTSLKHLHQVRAEGYGPIDPRSLPRRPRGLFDTWEAYLTCQLDDHLGECVRLGAMTTAEAERTALTFNYIKNGDGDDFTSCLLHNDLSARNIIAGQVLDWDMAIIGDPLFELASYCALYADRPIEPTLTAYYGNHRPANWQATFWAYYLRISIARTVRRARHSIPEDPRYPKASQRIQLALGELNRL